MEEREKKEEENVRERERENELVLKTLTKVVLLDECVQTLEKQRLEFTYSSHILDAFPLCQQTNKTY